MAGTVKQEIYLVEIYLVARTSSERFGRTGPKTVDILIEKNPQQ